jgi:hypothetical protein
VKGMRRDQRRPTERARDRILDDNEIRVLWKAAEESATFGAIVRLLLLTAQRREKIVTMKREDVRDGRWIIATEAREKGNAGTLVLPQVALDIIEAQPVSRHARDEAAGWHCSRLTSGRGYIPAACQFRCRSAAASRTSVSSCWPADQWPLRLPSRHRRSRAPVTRFRSLGERPWRSGVIGFPRYVYWCRLGSRQQYTGYLYIHIRS